MSVNLYSNPLVRAVHQVNFPARTAPVPIFVDQPPENAGRAGFNLLTQMTQGAEDRFTAVPGGEVVGNGAPHFSLKCLVLAVEPGDQHPLRPRRVLELRNAFVNRRRPAAE